MNDLISKSKLADDLFDLSVSIPIEKNDEVRAGMQKVRDAIFKCIEAQPVVNPEEKKKTITNADRIRSMTVEELADFFCRISECCGNDACMLCPIFEGCAQNVMCVERWLKQEVKDDAGSD